MKFKLYIKFVYINNNVLNDKNINLFVPMSYKIYMDSIMKNEIKLTG